MQDAEERTARILLADDNADLREYLRRLLSERYEVEAVSNGAAALAAAKHRPPNLVLSDVMMPKLDGFSLLRELRADLRLHTIPAILLSARAGEEATIEGFAAGADDYLIKPFSARELLARVECRLEIARLRREAEEARMAALEETNRRLDEFLSIASHELRTPLTSIMANFQMAQKAAHQWREEAEWPEALQGRLERHQTMLERTRRQIYRLNRLVSDLLDASRITADKLELQLEPCEVGAVIQEAIEAQRASWPERQITLKGQAYLPLELHADADRLGQVVTNYLTNALKYSAPDQPVTVWVQHEGEMLRVAVQDHGPGLTAEQQSGLFERFFRVPGIMQQSGSGIGLGLGLYICKTIIERHGGQVGVASAPGQGSSFWFTLPLFGADLWERDRTIT